MLIYAHVRDMPQHKAAREWVELQFKEKPRIGIPWPSILSFVRLVTNPRVFPNPEPIEAAWGVVLKWLAHPSCWQPVPTDRHSEVLQELIPYISEANLVMDAHLAALAIEHGLILCSADADFARFPGLRWENPLRPRAKDLAPTCPTGPA